MKTEDYAVRAMESLIRYGKMPMNDSAGVANTAWKIAKRMKQLEVDASNSPQPTYDKGGFEGTGI